MSFQKTPIDGLLIYRPPVYQDSRGHFFESYNLKVWAEFAGIERPFVQDNQSYSCFGTIRGLHLQAGEWAQAKLVRVLRGRVWDVAVDLRPKSNTYGKYFGIELSEENKIQFYLPRGFAHGFVVLSDFAEFFYKCDNFYAREYERGIVYCDQEINIEWPIAREQLLLSDKDSKLPTFAEYRVSSGL